MLSERCHPNSLGHYMFFATLDTETGTVTFSDEKYRQENLDCKPSALVGQNELIA